MTCPRCRKSYQDALDACPGCGAVNQKRKGTFQVSTVLISSGGSDHVYRSVEEVPAPLRTQLLKSTSSANSATILIADRRGRKEIARAMRNLPGAAQRRLMRAVIGDDDPRGALAWLTPARRKVILAVVGFLTMAAVGLVLTRVG